jgi:hypothetical protein
MNITNDERINLKNLLSRSEDAVDNTESIRKLKHSNSIAADILKIKKLKTSFSPGEELEAVCREHCPFLYNKYTDIFNRIMKDELDLAIMGNLLTVMQMIEDEKVDQHEGSVIVGKILKELYVDSALKKADKLNEKYDSIKEEERPKVEGKKISWREFKMINNVL